MPYYIISQIFKDFCFSQILKSSKYTDSSQNKKKMNALNVLSNLTNGNGKLKS